MWFTWVSVASAGVWVHDLGAGYTQLSFVHQESGQVFLDTGELVSQTDPALLGAISPLFDEARYVTNDVMAYGELGIGYGFELVASVPFRAATNRWGLARGTYPDIVHRGTGIGDLTAGARFGKHPGRWALSAFTTLRLPLYDNDPELLLVGAGNSDFEDDRIPLGPGTIDVDLGGGIGRGLGRGWGLAEAGVRLRDRGYSTLLPARLQLGLKPVDRVAAWLGADAQLSFGDGRAPDAFRDAWGKGPIVIDNQSALSASLGASVELVGGLGLVGSVSRVVHAVRFPRLTTGSLGLSYTFDVVTTD